MKKILRSTCPLILLLVIGAGSGGCAALSSRNTVNEDRAGCVYVDGKGRAGGILQYAKGAAKGVYVYIGKNLKGEVTVTCNANVQEIKSK